MPKRTVINPRKPSLRPPTIRFIIDWYDAWLRERHIPKIAAALDITVRMMDKWCNKWPELKLARDLAIERRKGSETLKDYVFQRLSPEAKGTWDEIQFWKGNESAYEKVQEILSGKAIRLKQELFIHALVTSNFDVSSALRETGTSYNVLNTWKQDLEFLQLMEQIEWHKKNFFETRLIDLVDKGNPGAVMFVNRTRNADRGYQEKMQVQHTGRVEVGFKFEELDLDLETKTKILDAIRRRQALQAVPESKQLGNGSPVIDVTPEPVPAQVEA